MEKLHKQIVNNTEPRRSFLIVVCNNNTRFKTWFKPPIQLDKRKDYEIALINQEHITHFQIWIDPTIVLVIHLVLIHNGLKLLFMKVVITLRILMSLFNEK